MSCAGVVPDHKGAGANVKVVRSSRSRYPLPVKASLAEKYAVAVGSVVTPVIAALDPMNVAVPTAVIRVRS
jgi:hypothetical protein